MGQDLFAKYATHLKLVGIVFVGIHVPLVLAGIAWLAQGRSEPQQLMFTVLLGTVAGLVISVAGIWSILRAQSGVPA